MPLAIGIAGTAILLSLGVWQVQRLHWKQAVLVEIETRMARPPVPVPKEPDMARDRFVPVAVSGTLDGAPVLVFTSVKGLGVRYRLIQPLETDAGRRLLVERGLIDPDSVGELPLSGRLAVEGMLHWPDEADAFTPPPDPGTGVRYARDLQELSVLTGAEPVLVVATRSAPADPRILPRPLDPAGIPNDHLQYAVTWFGLAAVWVAMTALWLRRLSRPREVER